MTTDASTLGELVVRAARVLRRTHRDALGPHGLSPHHSRAMGVVARHGEDGVGLSALARELGIAPRSATDVVDALAEHGLLQRRASATDRRAIDIRLTAQGVALRRTLDQARDDASQALFSTLDDDERNTLARLLQVALTAADR